jgi:tetratricopeptide (TPR) repeat protein
MENKPSFLRLLCTGVYPYLILLLAIGVVYATTLTYDFVDFDDISQVTANQAFIEAGGTPASIFSHSVYISNDSCYYRPILNLSFMLDVWLGGDRPFVYHCTNVCLHVAAVFLFFVFLRRLSYSPETALLTSLVFAVTPALLQAVAWVPGRNDSLLGVTVLAAFLALWQYLNRPRWYWYLSHLFLFAVAILTKENAVMLVPLSLLYLYLYPQPQERGRRVKSLLAGWGVLATAWLIVRALYVQQLNDMISLFHMVSRVFSVKGGLDVLFFLGKALFPVTVKLYPVPSYPTVLLGVLAMLLLFAGLRRDGAWRKERVIFGASWFLLFILPTFILNLPYCFEHRLYVPLMGLSVVVVEAGRDLFGAGTKGRTMRIAAAITVVALFAVICPYRTSGFANRMRYWEQAVAECPGESYFRYRRARVYSYYGRASQALEETKEVVKLNPKFRDAHLFLATLYQASGNWQEARKEEVSAAGCK